MQSTLPKIFKPRQTSRRFSQIKRAAGFTLVEVMVALVIVGVALPALVINVATVSDNTGRLEEKTVAYWAAQNKLNELMVDWRISGQVERSEKRGSMELAEREWFFWTETEEERSLTQVLGSSKKVYRMSVYVGRDNKNAMAHLVQYVHE